MVIDVTRDAFLWCFVINMGILLWWAGFLLFAKDWVYALHSRFFNISRQHFDMIHYAGMTFFKVFIFAFNLVPFIALSIAG